MIGRLSYSDQRSAFSDQQLFYLFQDFQISNQQSAIINQQSFRLFHGFQISNQQS
jgi:hypothetical protein